MGLGFLVMCRGRAATSCEGDKVMPTWLLLTYLLHTFGELCLSPVGLSYVTKLAPARFVGQMMGVWFLATSVGNLSLACLPAFRSDNLAAMPGQFMHSSVGGGAGIVLLVLTPSQEAGWAA